MRGERGMSDVVETTSDEDGGAQRGGARARGADGGAQGLEGRKVVAQGGSEGARGVKGRGGVRGDYTTLP